MSDAEINEWLERMERVNYRVSVWLHRKAPGRASGGSIRIEVAG